jgi:ADP-heptose:LPS heptosyltransferase
MVALDGLRELVLASALTPLLRSRYPNAELTVWCGEQTSAIAGLMPGVDRVEAADPCWEGPRDRPTGSVVAFAGSLSRLRRHKFDVAVIGSARARTSAAVSLTGAKTRIGHASAWGSRWLTEALPAADETKSALLEMARLLDPLGVRLPRVLQYSLRPEALTNRIERLRPLLGPRPVALYPFASNAAHAAPLKQWIRVAVAMARRGFDPLWIGTARQLREIHRVVGSSAWTFVDRIGDSTLAETAAALSLARLFIGHDSGTLHLAAALGVPVAGVFTPGETGRAYPAGTGESRLLLRRSPEGVTAEQILEVVDDLPMGPALHLVH